MADPFLFISRIAVLIVVPLMLLFPLVFAMLVPNSAGSDAGRIAVRGRTLTLVLATAVLSGLWVGLMIAGLRFPDAQSIANYWWLWFFPLWLFLACPLIAIKRPEWGSDLLGLGWPGGSTADGGEVRSASLINRERCSPVTRGMWAAPILALLLSLAAIAARGMLPFPTHADAAGGGALAARTARQRRT